MQVRFARRLAHTFLCFSPLFMAAVWSTRLLSAPIVPYAIAGVLIAAVLIAAWIVGARVVIAGPEEHRRLALAGALLVGVWASLTLIGVLGTPDQATASENKVRYLVLLADAIAMAGAFMILRDVLSDAGERFFSSLGFAATVLAGPLYVTFAVIQHLEYRAAERLGSGELPSEFGLLDTLSLGLLFAGAILNYLATGAFAAALGRIQWLGRRATRAYIGTSLLAVVCVGVRLTEALLLRDGPMWGFSHWYSMPGFVFLIPAVPWIIPCLLGFGLLRRAGDQQLSQ